MALVQVTEATSSVVMEKSGFKRALDELLEAGRNVSTVVTDRHMGIQLGNWAGKNTLILIINSMCGT